MSFLVPAAFFLIFAAISASTTAGNLDLTVVVADEVQSPLSRQLVDALRGADGLEVTGGDDVNGNSVREMVRRGTGDVGLILRGDFNPGDTSGSSPFVLISDPTRGLAATVLSAEIRQAYFEALSSMRRGANPAPHEMPADTAASLFEREDVAGRSAGLNHIAYHAGAVAVLFLLFSAVHGALTLLEESETGILERILAGPGSTAVLINGKFLYLVTQGFVQVGVIFVVAWLVHGVDLPGHSLSWAAVTLAAACTAAGMALALTTACRTRRQAQNIANVAVLIVSALGGSMVPRFLMPPFLQDLGWFTPNTWALEAYTAIFWRDEPFAALALPVAVLFGAAAVGLLLSHLLARRLHFV